MVHSVTCAPDNGCSSSGRVKAVLLWFDCLLESLFLCTKTPTQDATTFYAGQEMFFEYLHIPTNTIKYMQIHAYTCTYSSNTCRYQCIAYICMYLPVLHVCEGISLWACIACFCRYCMYVQVHSYAQVMYVSAGIVCMSRCDIMSRYCMYLLVSDVCAGMILCEGIACIWRYYRYVKVCHYVAVCAGIAFMCRYF